MYPSWNINRPPNILPKTAPIHSNASLSTEIRDYGSHKSSKFGSCTMTAQISTRMTNPNRHSFSAFVYSKSFSGTRLPLQYVSANTRYGVQNPPRHRERLEQSPEVKTAVWKRCRRGTIEPTIRRRERTLGGIQSLSRWKGGPGPSRRQPLV